MSNSTQETPVEGGRLPMLHAAMIVARRDFTAILFSRAFIFFLLGPLFPVVVMILAQGVGGQVQQKAQSVEIGLAMAGEEVDAMLAARADLSEQMGGVIPEMVALKRLNEGEVFDAKQVLETSEGQLAAIVTGTLEKPELTATQGRLDSWQGVIAMTAGFARDPHKISYPEIGLVEVASSGAAENTGRLRTAQSAQLVLFLLMMMLAGMVLSNLVEEKGNKIIEVLAAAIPMDAVFLGKLFAMLAVSMVGIAVWGGTAGAVLLAGGMSLSDYANPGVGWPMFFALFAIYFAMGYLLLGAIFLTVGSLAATVREVQTLSMPVTMVQILVFFFASLSVTNTGSWSEYGGMAFPLSSPFVMVARAASDEALWPHAVAIAWQMVCVAVFIRVGASLFRKRVMKSGPRGAKGSRSLGKMLRGLFRSGSAKSA